MSRGAIGLSTVLGLVFATNLIFAAATDSKSAATPQVPEYPKDCDTIAPPVGFTFPNVSSALPFDLGSLRATVETTAPAPAKMSSTAGHAADHDCGVFETQKQFDLFSWATFIGLNWPADSSGNPISGDIGTQPTSPRVWEYYLSPSQIFKANGVAPDPWGTPENEARTLSAISKHTEILDEVDEAFFNLETPLPPITDLNNEYVRYEIRINKAEYDYIVTNTLYNTEGQQTFINNGNTVSFPSGKLPVGPTPGQRGAMELKVAWKQMGAGDDPSKFYTITPIVEEPFNKPHTITGKTYGLVGMHIMVRTESAPEWVWATFEHVDNAPIMDLRTSVPDKFKAKGSYSFWNKAGTHSFGGFDPAAFSTLDAMKSAPNYYQPKNERQLSQITKVITDNNAVSDSKWTKNLNATMQGKLAGTVWANYRLISTQWPVNPGTKPAGNPAPVSLGNPVLETYMQVNGSCMNCHAGATYGNAQTAANNANFSFMLQRAKSAKSKTTSPHN